MIYNEIDNKKSRWLVLLHCVCGNEKVFKNQMDLLNKHYNILVIRLAGHGIKSEINEATFDFVINEIHDFTLRKNCKVDILGISIGAMIATKYISIYPQTVEKLYLIGNIYGFSIPFFKTGYIIVTKLNKLLSKSLYMYFITKVILPGKTQNKQRKRLYINSKKMESEFLYSWMSEMLKFILDGKKYLNTTIDNQLKIQLIYGEKDKIFLDWVKFKLRKNQNVKIHLIKEAGHLCNIDNPEYINKIIEEGIYENISHI